MGAIPAWLLTHSIIVEPYAGTSGSGVESYGAPVTYACFFERKIRRVRTPSTESSTGDEVLSSATAWLPLNAGTIAACNPGARVTMPGGAITYVIDAMQRDGGGLPTPDHLEIVLT